MEWQRHFILVLNCWPNTWERKNSIKYFVCRPTRGRFSYFSVLTYRQVETNLLLYCLLFILLGRYLLIHQIVLSGTYYSINYLRYRVNRYIKIFRNINCTRFDIFVRSSPFNMDYRHLFINKLFYFLTKNKRWLSPRDTCATHWAAPNYQIFNYALKRAK